MDDQYRREVWDRQKQIFRESCVEEVDAAIQQKRILDR